MEAPLTHAVLKAKQRELRGGFPETMGLRVHRAISWIRRAEAAGDDDARFLFLRIGFNAAYADEEEVQNAAAPERDAFKDFFQRVVRLDADQRIYDAIWDNFSGPIRVLLHNEYVFTPFWKHHNGAEGFEGWEEWFRASERRFRRALEERDTVRVLRLVFDRLYVLRNQIVHGGATWNSQVNRDQVRHGAAILAFLMPVFVDVMMDNPYETGGVPSTRSWNRAALSVSCAPAGSMASNLKAAACDGIPKNRDGSDNQSRGSSHVVRGVLHGRPPEEASASATMEMESMSFRGSSRRVFAPNRAYQRAAFALFASIARATPPNLRRHCQRPLASGQEQVTAESLTLCRSIDGKPTQAEDRYVIATEPSRQIGGDVGELDGPGTDRAVPENTGWLG